MGILRKLFRLDEPDETPDDEEVDPNNYHCIRFTTARGEQLGMLLTQEEFETAVNRWVQTIQTMPIQETSDTDEGSL